MRKLPIWILSAFLLVGCASPQTPAPTRIPASTRTPVPPTPVPLWTATPFPSPTLIPTSDELPVLCGSKEFDYEIDFSEGHFLFHSPIGDEGNRLFSFGYLYGESVDGTREPHHGVDFSNPEGTPVLAAAEGVVIFAGSDKKEATFSPWRDFYGNHIVIEHHFEGIPETLYTLYAHLSSIDVTEGEKVSAGEKIGEVGSTGVAIGSHLHFEVRVGGTSYEDTRNPALWLLPSKEGTGILFGRVEDSIGRPVHLALRVTAYDESGKTPGKVYFLETYAPEKYPVQSDSRWQENFVLPDLPPGKYRIAFVRDGRVYEQWINVAPGKLSQALIQVLE